MNFHEQVRPCCRLRIYALPADLSARGGHKCAAYGVLPILDVKTHISVGAGVVLGRVGTFRSPALPCHLSVAHCVQGGVALDQPLDLSITLTPPPAGAS